MIYQVSFLLVSVSINSYIRLNEFVRFGYLLWERVLNGPPLSASSDISVHPVLGVVKYTLALDMSVKAIVGDHASLAQV